MAVDPEVRENTLAALDIFRVSGCTVEEVDIGWGPEVDEASMRWYTAMHFGREALWSAKEHRDLLTPYAAAMADAAANLKPDDVARSWEVQHRMYQAIGALFERYDVLICPTLSIGAVRADHNQLDKNFTVDGKVVDPEYGWVLTHQFNMLSNCPVMSVPSGRDRHGVPTGIQIVGPTFRDESVFQAAYQYEMTAPEMFIPEAGRPAL